MAFATHLQQVLAYLKQGHKLQPTAAVPTMGQSPGMQATIVPPVAPPQPGQQSPPTGVPYGR